MAFYLRNNDDKVLEGNKYYMKITKLLQDEGVWVWRTFKLHRETWLCGTLFYDKRVYIETHSFNENDICVDELFYSRVGIAGDDLKVISAKEIDIRCLDEVIMRHQFDSIRLSNKVFYLFVEIRSKDENVQKMKDRKETIESDYRELFLSGKNSDVTLGVKQKKFYCHRCILAARSPVFAEMMKNVMEENVSGELIIEDAEHDIFQEFLLYLYSGNENILSWKNITELYILAHKFGMEDMKNACRNDIKDNIRKSNFCELFQFSLLQNDPEITKTTVQFFLKHSKDIVLQEDWRAFLSEDSKEWLSVDFVKDYITTENFFFFFKLSQMQNDSKLTETTVQFFLRNIKDIFHSDNWMTFLAESPVETDVLIRALADK